MTTFTWLIHFFLNQITQHMLSDISHISQNITSRKKSNFLSMFSFFEKDISHLYFVKILRVISCICLLVVSQHFSRLSNRLSHLLKSLYQEILINELNENVSHLVFLEVFSSTSKIHSDHVFMNKMFRHSTKFAN